MKQSGLSSAPSGLLYERTKCRICICALPHENSRRRQRISPSAHPASSENGVSVSVPGPCAHAGRLTSKVPEHPGHEPNGAAIRTSRHRLVHMAAALARPLEPAAVAARTRWLLRSRRSNVGPRKTLTGVASAAQLLRRDLFKGATIRGAAVQQALSGRAASAQLRSLMIRLLDTGGLTLVSTAEYS